MSALFAPVQLGRRAVRCLIAVFLVGLAGFGPALAQQEVPALTGHVVDASGTLNPEQRGALEARLAAFEQAKGSQIVLLLVPSTQPEDISSYANRVGNSWKIGRKEVGDGVLLIVAIADRKVRIEVAKTLEGAIPDLAAKRIIDQNITPRFKQGDYAGGLDAATGQLMALISGEALPVPSQARPSAGSLASGFDWTELAVLMFFAVPIAGAVIKNMLGSKWGSVTTGSFAGALVFWLTSSVLVAGLAAVAALIFTLISNTSLGGRGHHGGGLGGGNNGGFGGGGFSGGGGFGSGGGGDFGGGGASGDW